MVCILVHFLESEQGRKLHSAYALTQTSKSHTVLPIFHEGSFAVVQPREDRDASVSQDLRKREI